MARELNCLIRENGFALVEVLVSLVLLSLLVVCFMGNITISQKFIARGGEKTIARDYACSIVESVRMYSSQLPSLNLSYYDEFEFTDDNFSDTDFCFCLDSAMGEIHVPAPNDFRAVLLIKLHDDSAYYKRKTESPPELETEIELNLYEITADVYHAKRGELLISISTVISAR